MNEIIIFNPHNGHWTTMDTGSLIPPPRKHHTAVVAPDGHTIIVYGGEINAVGGPVLNDIWTLDSITWTWSKPSISGPVNAFARSNHTAIVVGNQMIVIAGSNATSRPVEMQVLDLSNWAWVQTVKGQGAGLAVIGGLGGVIGTVAGGLVLIILCVGIWWWCIRRKVKERMQEHGTRRASVKDVDQMQGKLEYVLFYF